MFAAVFVGVLSGLGSGLAGTLLTIRYSRRTEHHRRVLDAAQDLAALIPELFASLDRAVDAVDGGEVDEPSHALVEPRRLIREAEAKLHRLGFVVGQDTPLMEAAATMLIRLSQALTELDVELWPPLTSRDWEELDALEDDARERRYEELNELRADLILDEVRDLELTARIALDELISDTAAVARGDRRPLRR